MPGAIAPLPQYIFMALYLFNHGYKFIVLYEHHLFGACCIL